MLNVDYSYILQMIPRIAFDFIPLTLANRHATKYVGTSPFGDVRSHRALDNFKDDRMKVDIEVNFIFDSAVNKGE